MAFTLSYIIAAFLLYFVGVTIADDCYSDGMKWGDIFDGDTNDPITDFCLEHHGATFKEGGQAKGCVDTSNGKRTTSLNITIEFTSIPDESKAVNFTAWGCERVLRTAASRCEHGGKDLAVSLGPDDVSPTMKARDEGHSNMDQRDSMENIRGQDARVPPFTTVVSLIPQNSTTTTNQPAETPETSVFFNSTAKWHYAMKANATVPDTVKITTTVPFTLTIPAATDASSTSTTSTTTTSNFISTTAGSVIITRSTTYITIIQSSSSSTAMNSYFTAKVKMDPNDCGCAHCK